jgi:hypothetical protein
LRDGGCDPIFKLEVLPQRPKFSDRNSRTRDIFADCANA